MTNNQTLIWNRCIYRDCMDTEYGLPSLPDKSIDLCITDPPWNIGFDLDHRTTKGIKSHKSIKRQRLYNDNIENYEEFTKNWFNEIKRICNHIIIAPGRQNLKLWYEISNPIDIFIHYKINGSFGSYVAHFNCFDPYLYYGNKRAFFRNNVFAIPLTNSFLRKKQLIHTSPKNFELWYKIIDGINPKTVIDPFLGSGTTAEVCTKLGIPWIGFEIKKEYSQDIDKRIKNCKKEPSQKSIIEAYYK